MKERPIVLSAPMVRAILAGTKTQARRVVRWPVLGPSDGRKRRVYGPGDVAEISAAKGLCPHGSPGDMLWVRETWRIDDYDDANTIYAADHPEAFAETRGIIRWRPSIHMPRERARLSLRVTSVRVERLHAITDEDARAEGVLTLEPRTGATTARERFADMWSEINGRASWDASPWVWVVSFECVSGGGER